MAIQLKFNNLSTYKDLICFNSAPNIITVEENVAPSVRPSGIASVNNLHINDESSNELPTISIDGHSIIGTTNIDEVGGRKFLVNGSDRNYTTLSIINAFRGIPYLDINFQFIFNDGGTIKIVKKSVNTSENFVVTTTNLEGFTFNYTTKPQVSSELGGKNSKIYIDIFYNNTDGQRLIGSNTTNAVNYLTTLEKEFYGQRVNFNISPVISTIADYNGTSEFKAVVYATVDGVFKNIGVVDKLLIVKGYSVNQGGTYLNLNGITNTMLPALNVKRGSDKQMFNNSILYVYEPNIILPYYKIGGYTSGSVNVRYLESDESVIHSEVVQFETPNATNYDVLDIELAEHILRDASFVEIVGTFGIIRYTVINPPFANAECSRIMWHNSYGGTSFFDFVGEKEIERKIANETYDKSLLNYYTNPMQEQSVVYNKSVELSVSVKTHLIEQDGLWQIYDLQNAYKAWTRINGVDYNIIIDSVTIDEPNDNVFTATVKYKFSLLDTFN